MKTKLYAVCELTKWENTEIEYSDGTRIPLFTLFAYSTINSIGYLEVFDSLETLRDNYPDSQYITLEPKEII